MVLSGLIGHSLLLEQNEHCKCRLIGTSEQNLLHMMSTCLFIKSIQIDICPHKCFVQRCSAISAIFM